MKMEPAYSISRRFGGAKRVADIVGKHFSRVYRWTYPETAREGTGGLIPTKDAKALLDYAEQHEIDIEAGDFFSADRLQKQMAREAQQ